jgi:hypothetical protein
VNCTALSSRSRVLSTSLRAFQTPLDVAPRRAQRANGPRARQEPAGAFTGSACVEMARDSDRARDPLTVASNLRCRGAALFCYHISPSPPLPDAVSARARSESRAVSRSALPVEAPAHPRRARRPFALCARGGVTWKGVWKARRDVLSTRERERQGRAVHAALRWSLSMRSSLKHPKSRPPGPSPTRHDSWTTSKIAKSTSTRGHCLVPRRSGSRPSTRGSTRTSGGGARRR